MDHKLKAIYLISHARISGPVNQSLNILNGMKSNGAVDAGLVTLAPEITNNSWLYKFADDNIDVYTLNMPLWKTLFCVPKLKRYLKENDIKVIHSSGFRANFVASLMPKSYLKVSTQRCAPGDIGEKFPKLFRGTLTKLYLRLIKRLNVNVACSQSLSQIYKICYGLNVPFVQNGVNCDYFCPLDDKHKAELRQELNIGNNKKVFLILGSLRARKNNELAIRVFNELLDVDAQVIIVGDGPERERLESMCTNQNVKFIGATSTPIKYLQAADTLISCSIAEGLPNTVLEALACGLPCILSDIGPHKELISGCEAGSIFSLKDENSLKETILASMLWNKRQSIEARKLAETRFDRKIVAKNYENIYKQYLGI